MSIYQLIIKLVFFFAVTAVLEPEQEDPYTYWTLDTEEIL